MPSHAETTRRRSARVAAFALLATALLDDIREMLVARCPDLRIAAWPAAPQ